MARDQNWHGLTEWQANQYRNGKSCEICGSDLRLAVDHSHATGGIRGVLCSHCNLLVGLLENTEKLSAVFSYLERYALQPPLLAAEFPSYEAPKLRKPVAAHGTLARYNHRTYPCRYNVCRAFMAERSREKFNHNPRPSDWGSPKHGTYAMYQAERKRGEDPCEECREANRRNHRDLRKARPAG